MTVNVTTQELNVYVSQEDNDTKEFTFEKKGTTIEFTLGGITKKVNLSDLVPATQADRFLSNVTYDKNTKELVFTTSKNGEEDTTFRIPVEDIFKLEIEEIFTNEDVNFSFSYFNHTFKIEGNIERKATALGRIKNTDWYVVKFDNAEINDLKSKIEVEKTKRWLTEDDLEIKPEYFVIEEHDNGNLYIKPNAPYINILHGSELKSASLPNYVNILVNGNLLTSLYNHNAIYDGETDIYKLSVQSSVNDIIVNPNENLNIELVTVNANKNLDAGLNTDMDDITKTLTININDIVKKRVKEAFWGNSDYSSTIEEKINPLLYTAGIDLPQTVLIREESEIFKDISKYELDSLPTKIKAYIGSTLIAEYDLQIVNNLPSYTKNVIQSNFELPNSGDYSSVLFNYEFIIKGELKKLNLFMNYMVEHH